MLKRFLVIKRTLIGAYLTLGTFLLAHTVNAFIADALRPPILQVAAFDPFSTREPNAGSPRELADSILARRLFPLPPDTNKSGEVSETAAPPLNVAKKVALLGTVMAYQGGLMAVLEDLSTKKQSLYRMGEQIPSVGALSAIEKTRVLFREGKQEEWLDSALTQQMRLGGPDTASSSTMARPSTSQRRILERREIEAAVADPTRLLTQAQAVPYLTDGKLDGLRLYTVMPLGFFDKIGLQANDVLQRINGVELRDPGILLSLFQQLRHERTIRVDLLRNQQPQTLAYEIR